MRKPRVEYRVTEAIFNGTPEEYERMIQAARRLVAQTYREMDLKEFRRQRENTSGQDLVASL
jgi:hypothetical protein